MQFSALYGAIRTKLQDSADTHWGLQEKKDAINRVLRDFCVRTRITEGLVTLTQNGTSTAEYIAPTGSELERIDMLTTGNFELVHITVKQAFRIYAGQWKTMTGQPIEAVYGDYGRTTGGGLIVRVIPDPGTALTDLEALGLTIPVLSLDTDVPPFQTTYHDCLVDGACAELLEKDDENEDMQQAAYFRQKYEAGVMKASAAVGQNFDASPKAVRIDYF
jgi:hypothetical protein